MQIYGGKQKGKLRRRENRKRESKRYMRGSERRHRPSVFMVQMESEGPGSIVHRLGDGTGLPLGGTALLCGRGN